MRSNKPDTSRVVINGINQPVILSFPEVDKKCKTAVMQSPLYTNAVCPADEQSSMLTDHEVSTNGWDTVSISRVSALNVKIAAEKTYPASVEHVNGTISLKGDFLPWRIVPGGDGKNVTVSMPMKSGTYNGMNQKNVSLQDVEFTVMVRLAYFPIPEPKAKDGKYELFVNTVPAGTSEPIAAVIGMTAPEGRFQSLEEYLVRGMVEEWINKPENLKKFDTLFSTISINNMGAGSEEFKWLRSTAIGYAYTDMLTEESSIFGVLSMTNGRSAADLPHQLPAVKLGSEDNAIFVINRAIYARYQLYPSLSKVFEGSQPSDFSISDDSLTITGKNIKLDSVEHDGDTYYPVAKTMTLSLDSTAVKISAEIETDIQAGVYTTTVISASQRLKLAVNSKNEQVMVYETVGDPIIVNSTHIESWVIVTEIILGVVAVVLLLVAAVTGGLAAAIIVSIAIILAVLAVTMVIVKLIQKAKGEGLLENAPPITPMAKLSANQVKWPFSEEGGFTLTDIQYNGEVIFYGRLKLSKGYEMAGGRMVYNGVA